MSKLESNDETEPKLIDGSKYAHMNLEQPPTEHGLLAIVLLVFSFLILCVPNFFGLPLLGIRSQVVGFLFVGISTLLDVWGIISAIRGLGQARERGISLIVLFLLLGWTGILALLWLMVITGGGLIPFM